MRLSLIALASLLLMAVLVPGLGCVTEDQGGDIHRAGSAAPFALMTEDSLMASKRLGPVFAYGVRITRPYTFNFSVDGRRLYLNGYFFNGATDTTVNEIEVSEATREEHGLAVRAGEAMKQGKTFEETLAIYAEVLRMSPLTSEVRISYPCVYVTWASSPDDEEEVIIPREKLYVDLGEALTQDIAHFWSAVRGGRMIAFGRGGYHLSVPSDMVPKTLEQIERIRRGIRREQLDLTSTGLWVDDFQEDLYHSIQKREED